MFECLDPSQVVSFQPKTWDKEKNGSLTPSPPDTWLVAWYMPREILETYDIGAWVMLLREIRELEEMFQAKLKRVYRDSNGNRVLMVSGSIKDELSSWMGLIHGALENCECGGYCLAQELQDDGAVAFLSKWWRRAKVSDRIDLVMLSTASLSFALQEEVRVWEKNKQAYDVARNMIADFGSSGPSL